MTAARLGQAERAPAAGFFGLDQPLVSKLLQGRVDGTRAWPPGAVAAIVDLGHDLVPVARALAQQCQDRGADIAAASLRPARRSGRSWPPAAPWPTGTAWPLPETTRPALAPAPRPAPPARACRACQHAQRVPEVTGKGVSTVSGVGEPGVEVSGRRTCCTHLLPQ